MTEARPLGEYVEAMRARKISRAVLLGKGPTLDTYSPMGDAYVIGVNNVCAVKRCDAAVYADQLFESFDFPQHVTLLRSERRKESHGGRGYYWSKKGPYAMPQLGPGTGTLALSILGMIGVPEVWLYGFDAFLWHDYAKCLAGTHPNPVPSINYRDISFAMRRAIDNGGLGRVVCAVPPGPIVLKGDAA